MAEKSLGVWGKRVCWVSYLFLFYALLVAYTAASGAILSGVLQSSLGIALPQGIASLLFALFFGFLIYLGTRPIDLANRALMAGLIVCYLAMIALGLPKIQLSHLTYSQPGLAFVALPVLVISFGFQNIIPSLTSYLRGDLQRVRIAILGGSLIALSIYLLWTMFVLGIVPASMIHTAYENGEEATNVLQKILGSSVIGLFAQGFAFFAIVTSFLAQGLSLVHFIADGLKVSTDRDRENLWLCLIAIAPPAFLAVIYPDVFFKALNFAGGICAVILFGLLPIAMSWVGRYRKNIYSSYRARGGKLSLGIAFAFALLVIFGELSRIFTF
jgi:tyrosine-specific transport protein